MQLQSECNVPAGKCSSVIKVVADSLFGVQYEDEDLPCLQTAVNIADEGHVLSKVQAAEQMLEADNLTLHTDGTSRGGKKIYVLAPQNLDLNVDSFFFFFLTSITKTC